MQRPELPGRRALGVVEAVAAEWVDVGVTERGEAVQRGVVGNDFGVHTGEVIERGCRVARVPDRDSVDEKLLAEGVPMVVVLADGERRAGADDEMAAQRVQRLVVLELTGDPG